MIAVIIETLIIIIITNHHNYDVFLATKSW
jgi:hypothetical protein